MTTEHNPERTYQPERGGEHGGQPGRELHPPEPPEQEPDEGEETPPTFERREGNAERIPDPIPQETPPNLPDPLADVPPPGQRE